MNIKNSKLIISLSIVLSIIFSFYFLFLKTPLQSDENIAQILFFLALIVYQVRYLYLINVSKKGKITFQLIEKQKYPILFDTLAGIFLFCLLPFILAVLNVNFNTQLDRYDLIAFILYVAGTLITLISERQRKKWKVNNPNSLYKNGLFKYANHINYFGELLSFPSLCWLATGNVIVFAAVFIHQIIDFSFVQIPRQEKHFKKKYPQDFQEIMNRKKLIPLVY